VLRSAKMTLSPRGRLSLFLFCAASVLVTAGNTEVHGADTYQLRYRFTAEQVVHFESNQEQKFTTQLGTATESVANSSRFWNHYRVLRVGSNGEAVLERILDRAQMQNQFGASTAVQWDSQNGEPPVQFEAVAKSLHKALARFHVKSTGELVKLEPVQEAVQQLASTEGPPDASLNFLLVFPEAPVAVGQTWKDRFNVPVSLQDGLKQMVTIQRTYELASVQGNLATIRMKASVITPINNPEIEVQLIQRTPTGEIQFDMERGVLVSQTMRIERTLVGGIGPNSQITAISTSTERLVEPARNASVPQLLNDKN